MGAAADRISNEIVSGLDVVKGFIGDVPVLMSLERTSDKDTQYDEKHYFVIPFKTSEVGFTLHTMRYLPSAIPEVNDLPKRRVFHFPNEHHEGSLRELMKRSAKSIVVEKTVDQKNALTTLADDIDAWDNKLTYGMLFVGGLAALVNPLLGAGIAAKAVLPSVTGMLTKYGLRPIGEKLDQSQLKQQIKEAQAYVTEQFSGSDTVKVVNPILQELERALNTTAEQHDPLLHANLACGSIPELSDEHWRVLTERAVHHVYQDTYEDPSRHEEACLGPEDIRWLDVLFTNIKGD